MCSKSFFYDPFFYMIFFKFAICRFLLTYDLCSPIKKFMLIYKLEMSEHPHLEYEMGILMI